MNINNKTISLELDQTSHTNLMTTKAEYKAFNKKGEDYKGTITLPKSKRNRLQYAKEKKKIPQHIKRQSNYI